MRLAGYVRVSRVAGREGERFISPDTQRENIEHIAGKHTVAGWFTDLDQSGGKLERPQLEAALAFIESGQADGLAVAYLSRLSRSVVDLFHIVRRLEAAGADLLIADLGLDTSTPAGKLTRTMLAAIAEFELDTHKERWRDVKARAVKRGAFVASTPVGYDRDPSGRLVPNADAPHIREAFLLRAKGAPLSRVADYLNTQGVKPRKASQWASHAIPALLKVRAYIGESASGETVNRQAHEALVSRQDWEAAQPSANIQRTGGKYLLTGLARCSGCGRSMKPTVHKNGDTYSCRKHHGGGVCPSPAHVKVALLDEYVQAMFLQHAQAVSARAVADSGEQAEAQRRLEEAEAELHAYRDETIMSVIGKDAYLEGLQHRQDKVDEAAREISVLQPLPVIGRAELADRWPTLKTEHRRELLTATIDAVAVGKQASRAQPLGERVRVFWRGTGPENLSRSGRASSLAPIPLDLPADTRLKV
jgi:site-specific DNA recombinase